MISNTQSALVMLAAGMGIPLLAALNAALGQRLGSPAAAAVVLFCVALSVAGLTMVLTRGGFAGLTAAPPHLFAAGLFVAFYVLSVTWIAPHFGVGNAVFFVLLGQIVSAGLIDHFGLFGAAQQPFTLARGSGMALMAAGLFLTQIAGRA